MIPKTWENPKAEHPELKAFGDIVPGIFVFHNIHKHTHSHTHTHTHTHTYS